jgi:hypothetical protein
MRMNKAALRGQRQPGPWVDDYMDHVSLWTVAAGAPREGAGQWIDLCRCNPEEACSQAELLCRALEYVFRLPKARRDVLGARLQGATLRESGNAAAVPVSVERARQSIFSSLSLLRYSMLRDTR